MAWVETLPSGKYRAAYRDKNGKKRTVPGTFVHKKKAQEAATIAEVDANKPGWKSPEALARTWGDWCEEWWPTRGVEPGTAKRQESGRDVWLMPRWKDVPLAQISRHDIQAWVAEMSATHLAPSSVQRHLHLMSASLRGAIDAGVLSENPAARTRLNIGQSDKFRFLSKGEATDLLAEFEDPLAEAMVTNYLSTGFRWSEGTGLQIPRVNLRLGSIRVVETWDDSTRRLKPYPKGRKIRDVPIDDWHVEMLAKLIGKRKHGFVFERGGKPFDYHNFRKAHWLPAVERSGIGHVTTKDLRHTYASWLIQDGMPLAEVGKLLGHMSPVTTQIYAHLQSPDSARVFAAVPNVGAAARAARGANVGQSAHLSPGMALQGAARNLAETREITRIFA